MPPGSRFIVLPFPTIVLILIASIGISFPFFHPLVSSTEGMIRWILWGIASLTLLVIIRTFIRQYRAYGLRHAIKWVVTGRFPETENA